METPERIVIVGAGPTGLGAAYRLQQHGFEDFAVLEAGNTPGGLAQSYVDPQGFTWDVGGHVQFSHYGYYDRVLDQALGDDAWFCHQRESWVWAKQRFIPYPFQNNIHHLDAGDCQRALDGLIEVTDGREHQTPANFRQWIEQVFGPGIAEIFLYPYNLKVWGFPLETLDTTWIADRVALPNLDRIRENVRLRRDDVSWGPNRTFRFPARGGTGAIWKGVASLIDANRIRYGAAVTAVDLDAHRLTLADGSRVPYDALITSVPLDRFCRLCSRLTQETRAAAEALVSSACHIVGVGLQGPRPETLAKKCWIYFPEDNSPYYRVTVFSNYSPYNVPAGNGYWSLMAEVCDTPVRPVDVAGLRHWTLQALAEDGLRTPDAEVVSFWHHREPRGYPTPFLGRDEALRQIREELESHGVYSRGRFGAWLYEVSNQDHSFMQGVEVVNRLLLGDREYTIEDPDAVNRGKHK